jgi:hypothetical protein
MRGLLPLKELFMLNLRPLNRDFCHYMQNDPTAQRGLLQGRGISIHALATKAFDLRQNTSIIELRRGDGKKLRS